MVMLSCSGSPIKVLQLVFLNDWACTPVDITVRIKPKKAISFILVFYQ